jgi:tRNA modification GTPase
MAVRSLQGVFSKKINHLNEQLIQLRLYVEAALDFPEEEIDFINDGKISTMLSQLIKDLKEVRQGASQGALIREGLSVVIAGRPNAGKSTLINSLSGRDVAIVTEIAGTTRDVMREQILLDDIPLHVIDTAGLHDSNDLIEKEGIKRAWEEIQKADCLLMVIDACQEQEVETLSDELLAHLQDQVPIIRVYNKIDMKNQPAKIEGNRVYLSAKLGEGMLLLKEKLKEIVGYQPQEGQFLARRRHLQALDNALQSLLEGYHQLSNHHAGELLAEDLRLAHQSLCEITGEFSADDILGKIFSSFCIGK